jgi:hypothetical protein
VSIEPATEKKNYTRIRENIDRNWWKKKHSQQQQQAPKKNTE